MTIVSRNRLFFWRIVPVMLVTGLLAGPVMVAAAAPGGFSSDELISGLFVAAVMTVIMIVPAALLWMLVFNRITPNMLSPAVLPPMSQLPRPDIWRRAVWASMVSIWVGAITPFILLDILLSQSGGMTFAIMPWTVIPVAIGMLLTWLAFRGIRTEPIGRRE
jgi:hypothetical protein